MSYSPIRLWHSKPNRLILSSLLELGDCMVILFRKWFLQKIGHEGLNNMLLAYEDKSAYALCVFSLALGPNEELKLFDIMPLRSQLAEFITLVLGKCLVHGRVLRVQAVCEGTAVSFPDRVCP
ncbi:uncharacterized protein LOC141723330 [Apium graveolens]|uniref:uncharacterized protein LOC141723330 n=1 Tax=Apium graveolens TaxID=4045 RepID=UPI003D79993A